MSIDEVTTAIEQIPLIDHHVHGALRQAPQRTELEGMLSESDRPIPRWMTQFDSQIGLAIRKWCGPLLELSEHASSDAYVARRAELGEAEVNRRLLGASNIGTYLVETGYSGSMVLSPNEMTAASGSEAYEVVRLEQVLEDMAAQGTGAGELIRDYPANLVRRTAHARGVKSIIAYRYGFDFDPARPDPKSVLSAADSWLRRIGEGEPVRVDSPILLRYLLWAGVDRGLPIQLHTGYGDPDLELHRCDPLLLTRFIKLVEPQGVDILLLHCYPFHRNAGYLAQVFPHVHFDVGLGINYSGLRSHAIVAESLELAPFAKILFSSDAWGPAELHYLGARLWRRGMSRVLSGWCEDGELDVPDAIRIARMIGRDNAARIYGLAASYSSS